MKLIGASERLPHHDAALPYSILGPKGRCFLMESLAISERYNRISLFGCDPVLEIKGDFEGLTINSFNERAADYLTILDSIDAKVQDKGNGNYYVPMPKEDFAGEEDQRFDRKCSAAFIKKFMAHFKQGEGMYAGLYGGLAYRFIYLYEDIPFEKEEKLPAFHLFLYDTFIFYNHLLSSTKVLTYRKDTIAAKEAAKALQETVLPHIEEEIVAKEVAIEGLTVSPSDERFMELVEEARELTKQGELMEIVLARKLNAKFKGSAFDLYLHYRKTNPSPYQFIMDFGAGEYIVGASPEMMIRFENDMVHLRPISGTAPRGDNAIDDHQHMMDMLTSEKEKAELDMLVDLGRNDLAKICEPGIQVLDYRHVEKYSRVMHTVAEVKGKIKAGKTGLDALIATLNAGTLTGAPKLAAMRYIEEMEPHTRGYYGGAFGMFRFSGEIDTAIVIRTAHLHDGEIDYCSGATLLYDCDPAFELRETKLKAAAFQNIFATTQTTK